MRRWEVLEEIRAKSEEVFFLHRFGLAFVGRSTRAEWIGEVLVAILEVRGPMEARQLVEPLAELDSMRRFTVRSIGHIAKGTPGILMMKHRPRAVFTLEPGRRPTLAQNTSTRLKQIIGENLPPTGGEVN
jgi:hypothetical protein